MSAMAMEDNSLVLPPGFRFHPTDEEIITHYLSPKVLNHEFCARAMGEVDLNKCEPWDLPSKAKMGEKEWYFFCQRDRKYPTGMRTNRATESGYWKATGKDKEIYRGRGLLVGMKKTLVFYRGRAPKGHKSNWVMHEYRLQNKAAAPNLPKSAQDEWVVCRVFHKNTGLKRISPMSGGGVVRINSFTDELLDSPSLPRLMDAPYFGSGACAGDDSFDFKAIMASSVPTSSYFSSSGVGVDDHPLDPFFMNHNPPPSSISYSQQIHAHESNSYLSMPGEFGCSHREQHPMLQSSPSAIRRHCKAEQFSNQSMLSQDTGVSTDRNTEISSVVSKQDIGGCALYEDFDGPKTAAGLFDLHSMWRC